MHMHGFPVPCLSPVQAGLGGVGGPCPAGWSPGLSALLPPPHWFTRSRDSASLRPLRGNAAESAWVLVALSG